MGAIPHYLRWYPWVQFSMPSSETGRQTEGLEGFISRKICSFYCLVQTHWLHTKGKKLLHGEDL